MQKVDPLESFHTDEDNLDLVEAPTSLGSVPNIKQETPPAGVQSDPETPPKTKARSRFSSAIRRLSRSTRKKERPLPKNAPLPAAAEAVISSGGEETTATESKLPASEEAKPKKKSKLSRRFLLGGLRKSKSLKNSTDEEEQNALVSGSQGDSKSAPQAGANTEQEDNERASPEASDITPSGSPQRLERRRKVQITISKKVEQSAVSRKPRLDIVSGLSSETDYLTPIEHGLKDVVPVKELSPSPPSSPSKGALSDSPTKAKKKKLKAKKITTSDSANGSSSIKATTSATTASSTTTSTSTIITQTAQTTPTAEKFIITQSPHDTPPREQAPAKPSRVAAAPSTQTATSSGAIRKQPSSRAVATVASPPLTQRTSSGASISPTKSKRQRTPTNPVTSAELEEEFMQTPPGTHQRGHRYPKPTSTSSNETPSPTTSVTASSPTRAVTTISAADTSPNPQQEPRQRQRQIQFQNLSHASQSPSQSQSPSPSQSQSQSQPSTAAEEELLRQLIISDDHLHSTTTHPPLPLPPDSPALSPETRSPAPRHPSTSARPESASLLLIRSESVANTNSSGLDEVVSSAESAHPSEYSGHNIDTTRATGYPQDASSTTFKSNFVVGTHINHHRHNLQDELTFESNQSSVSISEPESVSGSASPSESESQSPVSETTRKRIPFVAQPTLYDETADLESSAEKRREALKFQTAVSEYSIDSEFDSGDNQMPAFGDLTMDQDMEPAIMTSSNTEKREHLYKILVIGELGTGKTSFIKRYVHQFFSQNYRATIGVDFALKVLHWDANTIVRLQLWDIAGQERFGNMTRVYYKEAVGAFIVFDVTRSSTFDCVSKWKEDLDSKVQLPDGSPIPCILLANKCDQEKQGVVASAEKMDEYVRENGFAGWFETSAKENINIDEAARALVNKILLNDKLISEADLADSEKFNLNNSGDQTTTEPKSKCSC